MIFNDIEWLWMVMDDQIHVQNLSPCEVYCKPSALWSLSVPEIVSI